MEFRETSYLRDIMPGVLGMLQKQQRAKLYQTNPALWAYDYLGVELWWKQEEIALSIVHNHNVAVKAGHSVGKSFLAGLLACWWIDVHPLGEAYVASTAPSVHQINSIVWREIRKFKATSDRRYKEGKIDHPLPGYITSDANWKLNDGITIGSGRKPPEHKEDAFQGLHAEYLLAIGDEACGLPEALIDDLGNITTGEDCRRLLIANPTVPSSYFGKIFREATGTWTFHSISVMDSPNFHGGGLCECHPNSVRGLGMRPESLRALVGQTYVDDKRRDYGENSARYKARVLGEFAYEVGQTLFTEEDIAPARDASFDWDEVPPVLGVDLSGNGPDSNVIYANYQTDEGSSVRFVDEWGADEGFDLDLTLEKIEGWAYKLGAYQINVDAAGMGVSIWQQLTKRQRIENHPWVIVGLNGGGPSPDRARWQQARAWWFDTVREQMRAGKVDVDPEDDRFERLTDELLSIQYEEGQRGLGGIQLEQKKDMKKRGLKSPDFADAFVLSLVDTSIVIANPLRNVRPGEKVQVDPWEMLNLERFGSGMPI